MNDDSTASASATVPAVPDAGYVEAEQVTLAKFKPGDVLADANVRKNAEATVDTAFVAKIKATKGNRVPAVVLRTAGGGHRLRYGFRRHIACERAGVLLYAMIAGDEGDSQAERRARILDQLAENDGRVPLTRSEEAAALLVLFETENMTATGIAKATGRGKPEIEAALAVARSPLASGAADRWEFLTLEMSAALTEFEDDPDPDALKRLVATAKTDPGRFAHVASELRATRAERAEKAKVTAPLIAEGYAIVENRPPNWKLIENLTQDGKPLSAGGVPEGTVSHAECAGRAVWVTSDWELTPEAQAAADAAAAEAGDDEEGYEEDEPGMMDEEVLRDAGYVQVWRARAHLCTDPDRLGHSWAQQRSAAVQTPDAAAAGQQAEAAEKEKEKNRRMRARNKLWYAANGEREKHLRALAGRKTLAGPLAEAAAWFGLDNLIGGPSSADLRYAIERGHETAVDLLGLTVEPGESSRTVLRAIAGAAAPKRRAVIHLVIVLAAYEKFCRDPHTWQNAEAAWSRTGRDMHYYQSRGTGEAAVAYLAWLEEHTGYVLSQVEEETVRPDWTPERGGPPADVAPPRAEVDTGTGIAALPAEPAVAEVPRLAGQEPADGGQPHLEPGDRIHDFTGEGGGCAGCGLAFTETTGPLCTDPEGVPVLGMASGPGDHEVDPADLEEPGSPDEAEFDTSAAEAAWDEAAREEAGRG